MHGAAVVYTRVAITDWSARSAAGDAGETWTAVAAGRSALVEDPDLGPCGRAVPADLAGPQRMDRLIADTCSGDLLAGLGERGLPAIAFSASKGDTGAWLPPNPPQAIWQRGPGQQAAAVVRRAGLRSYLDLQPVAACSTGLYAVLAAADALEYGRAQRALAGAADASLQDLLVAGFRSLGVLPRDPGGAGPGFAIGEGCGALRLEADPRPAAGTWRLTAGVRLGDASHETRCADPAVLEACLAALWHSAPEPELIVLHGTGTRAGDAYEHGGLDRGPWQHCPRVACKPVIGHCLGASATVELAAALEADAARLWKLSLGFGGHVAGVALERS